MGCLGCNFQLLNSCLLSLQFVEAVLVIKANDQVDFVGFRGSCLIMCEEFSCPLLFVRKFKHECLACV